MLGILLRYLILTATFLTSIHSSYAFGPRDNEHLHEVYYSLSKRQSPKIALAAERNTKNALAWDTLTINQKKAIQLQLTALGYNAGIPDGLMGPATKRAIIGYQNATGYPPTGILTSDQIVALTRNEFDATQLTPLGGPTTTFNNLPDIDCKVVTHSVRAANLQLTLEIEEKELKKSREIHLSFITPNRTSHPLFLMISFDEPVRFKGNGIYALLPGATAPFDLKWHENYTRIVVPLHVRGNSKRIIEITPLTLKEINITGALVTPTSCPHPILEVYNKSIKPSVSQPDIGVIDQFSTTNPLSVWASPKGDRIIEEYDGYFRIISSKTFYTLAEHVGYEPRFSPGGRFITAISDQTLQLYDSIDAALITTTSQAHDIAWDRGDSFMIVGADGLGTISTYSTLLENGLIAGTSTSCRVCVATTDSTYVLDLENNVAISIGSLGEAVAPLNGYDGYNSAWGHSASSKEFLSLEAFIKNYSGMFPKLIPAVWELYDGLKFTHIDMAHRNVERNLSNQNPLSKFLIKPLQAVDRTKMSASKLSEGAVYSTTSLHSAFYTNISQPEQVKRFIERMRDAIRTDINQGELVPALRNIGDPIGNGQYRLSIDPSIIVHEERFCEFDGYVKHTRDGIVVSTQFTRIWTATVTGGETLSLIGGGCTGGSAGYSADIWGLHRSIEPGKITSIGLGGPYVEVFNPGGGCGDDCENNISLLDDRYFLSWSADTGIIGFLDSESLVGATWIAIDGDLIANIFMTKDRKNVLQLNKNGEFFLYNIQKASDFDKNFAENADMKLKPSLYGLFSNDEIIVWNKNGHFDTSLEGTSHVHVKFPLVDSIFSIDQYYSKLRVRDLFQKISSGIYEDNPPIWVVPPVITTEKSEISNDYMSLSVEHTAGSLPKELRIYQDGLQTNTIPWWALHKRHDINVARASGARWLTVLAVGEDGLISAPLSVDMGIPKTKRRLVVLAVAVDVYDEPSLVDLDAAKTDAFRFISAISSARSQLYDKVTVLRPLADHDATKAAVSQAIRDAVSLSTEETDVALFFAGHGLKDINGDYYFGLSSTELAHLDSTALGWSSISNEIARASGRVIIFLDSCHSGDAGKALFATNELTARFIADGTPTGVTIFSASKGREVSLETPEARGGVFTAAVERIFGTDREAVDSNQNGSIELSEFYRSLRSSVEATSHGRQTPWMMRNRIIGEVGLF